MATQTRSPDASRWPQNRWEDHARAVILVTAAVARSCRVRRTGVGNSAGHGGAGDPTLLVHVGSAQRWQAPGADDRPERVAPVQSVRAADRLPHAEAARPPAWRRAGGAGATSRPGRGPRIARALANRRDPDLHHHSSAATQASGAFYEEKAEAILTNQ